MDATKRIEQLTRERDRYKSAVEWYADDDNWQNFEGDGYLTAYDNETLEPDNGKRAKAALLMTREA